MLKTLCLQAKNSYKFKRSCLDYSLKMTVSQASVDLSPRNCVVLAAINSKSDRNIPEGLFKGR